MPVGGGGLIAGIGAYIKALQPGVQVIGVEPVDADAMAQSLAAGRRVRLDEVGLFADGVAVQQVGEHTFPIVQRDGGRDHPRQQRRDLRRDQGHLRRHAHDRGAGRRAGARRARSRYVETRQVRGQRLAAVLSGANMNFDRLRFVAERAELGEGREALLAVTIPERPGAFREFCAALGARVVTEFNYRLSGREQAQIFVGVATRSHGEGERAGGAAARARATKPPICPATRWPSSTCATWSADGRRTSPSERVCRFEFPERPGALLQFLDAVGGRWNISLFHYRNHGADFGRVLAAFEVPDVGRRRVRGVPRRASTIAFSSTRTTTRTTAS